VRDTTSKPKIRRLISTGNATSLQHLPPRDTSLRVPAIVYVVGTQITVNFDSGAVQRVEVKNEQLAAGIYLEPEDSTRAKRAPAKGRPGTAPAGGARVLQRAPVSSTPAPPPTTTPNPPATPTAVPPRRR